CSITGQTLRGVEMSESTKASVGVRDDGFTQCHNNPQDQSAVVGLLNQISQVDGGCKEAPLAIKPRWGFCSPALHQAILKFRRKNKGLSVDGHVDPGGATLRKLNKIDSRGAPPSSSPTTASTPAIRTCTLPSGSMFEKWPADLLETLCRSYKAHGSGNRYLDNSFWGGAPANFEDALTRLGTACQNNGLKWVHSRAAAIKGLSQAYTSASPMMIPWIKARSRVSPAFTLIHTRLLQRKKEGCANIQSRELSLMEGMLAPEL